MSKNKEYAEKHAAFAMEQMRRYGIPASVILAQGILESSNGQSQLHVRKTITSASRLPTHGWLMAANTDSTRMTSRMRNSVVTTMWENHTSTIPGS